MQVRIIFAFTLSVLLLSACSAGPVCPSEDSSTRPTLDLVALFERYPTPGPTPTPAVVNIDGKPLTVERVVQGPLCNDIWSGTVYVTCNVQVVSWEENPTFLDGCSLEITPGTVVYVAAHNDMPYYKGCSCHFSDRELP